MPKLKKIIHRQRIHILSINLKYKPRLRLYLKLHIINLNIFFIGEIYKYVPII